MSYGKWLQGDGDSADNLSSQIDPKAFPRTHRGDGDDDCAFIRGLLHASDGDGDHSDAHGYHDPLLLLQSLPDHANSSQRETSYDSTPACIH